jgi:deoxycytidylate deaminase
MCRSVPLKLLKNKNFKKKQRKYIESAIEKAKQSPMNHKHGAVIIYRGKIIASGYNYLQQNKTYSYSIHAEVAAIKDFNKKFKKNINKQQILNESVLYVGRVGRESMDFPTKMSKPCKNCQKSMDKVGLKTVFWTTDDEINEKLN